MFRISFLALDFRVAGNMTPLAETTNMNSSTVFHSSSKLSFGSKTMDVLSAVLQELRLVSAAYRWLELRAPWRLAFNQAGIRGVHIVVRGRCELLLSRASNVVLEAGDLVMAPRADA